MPDKKPAKKSAKPNPFAKKEVKTVKCPKCGASIPV